MNRYRVWGWAGIRWTYIRVDGVLSEKAARAWVAQRYPSFVPHR